MKKCFKIFFIIFSVSILGIVIAAVMLNEVNAKATQNMLSSSNKNTALEVKSGIILDISNEQNVKVTYGLNFDGINKDNSFNDAEMEISYQETKKDGSSTTITEKYYSR